MTYATQADLITAFGEDELIDLTDPSAGVVDAAKVTHKLEDAEAVINAHLSERYTLPLSETPAILRKISCDIARYYLHQGDGLNPTEEVKDNFNAAIKMLDKICQGKISLGIAQNTASERGKVEISGSAKTFTEDLLKGY